MQGNGVEYSPAQLGYEPGPELDRGDEVDDSSPEVLAQLGRGLKHPTAWEQGCVQHYDYLLGMTEQQVQHAYF